MSTEQDNQTVHYAYDVHASLYDYLQEKTDKKTDMADVHQAYKIMARAMEIESESEIYAAAIYVSAIVGKYALKYGDREAAYAFHAKKKEGVRGTGGG